MKPYKGLLQQLVYERNESYVSCRRGLYTMNWERLHHYELYGVDSIWDEIWMKKCIPQYQADDETGTGWMTWKEQI